MNLHATLEAAGRLLTRRRAAAYPLIFTRYPATVHRGMIAGAVKAGVIPPNWRELVWEG